MRSKAWLLAALLPLAALAAEAPVPEPRVELEKDRLPRFKTGGNVLLVGGTVLPVTSPRLEETDVLILGGKIRAIGRGLDAAPEVTRIDCHGRFVVPGVIDCHSHIAISGGVNEMAEKVSAEVKIRDTINPKDVAIYRALAGGTTAAHLLHGSGNPIGGQDAVVKLRWGKAAKDMVVPDAPRGIKFALGENPTRQDQFPRTRMGMVATYRRAFTEGRAYAAEWKAYEDARARGEDPPPPRRDLRLEAIAEVLSGTLRIHCHCYRADEIVAFMDVCDEFGIKPGTFHHVLEAYKIVPELKKHGWNCTTFSDWWAYKVEAYDAIPANAAITEKAGIVTSVNSDSDELIRHLYLEAAKSVRYGGLGEESTLSLVTINPAKQLGIAHRTGSIEVGKDGDVAVWNGHPLSAYSHPILTLVEGEVEFERPEGPRPTDGPAALPAPAAFSVPAESDPRPLPPPTGSVFAITGARVEPVSSRPLEHGTVLVRDGKIEALGTDVAVPDDATVIDGKGLVVTPGLIEAGSWLGLVEISALKVTRDNQDSGEFQPDLVALTAVFPPSEHILVTRAAGITTALAVPEGGLIPGQASIVRLDGWTAKEMSVRAEAGLVLEFPSRPGAPPEGGPRPRRFDRLELLEKFFDKAREDMERRERARGTAFSVPPEPRLEAMAPYLRRERPVFLVADEARAIEDAVFFAEREKIRPILLSAKEAWKLAPLLAARNVPVIYGPVLDTPEHDWDPYDAPYAAAAVLANAGVKVAIRSGGSAMAGPRNLPFEAAMAASYGLGHDRALAAVTKVPAEILGLEGRGVLEPGKVADLVVSAGDPLEPTSRLRYVFIDGKPVSLESRQTRLEAQAREHR
jgi:imidazolonepropionase-like amidohydrolase